MSSAAAEIPQNAEKRTQRAAESGANLKKRIIGRAISAKPRTINGPLRDRCLPYETFLLPVIEQIYREIAEKAFSTAAKSGIIVRCTAYLMSLLYFARVREMLSSLLFIRFSRDDEYWAKSFWRVAVVT